MKFLGYTLLIAILLACLIFAFTACDDNDTTIDEDDDDEYVEELVAGKDDLSMYELLEDSYSGKIEIVLMGVKEEFKNKITTAIIPSSIYNTNWYAFENCKNLKKVIIEDGVNYIGVGTFKGCRKLESVEIGDSISVLYKETFMNCVSLEEITLHEGVECISEDAFKGCKKLKNVKMSKNISVRAGAFDGTPFCETLVDGMIYVNTIAYKYVGDMPQNTTYKLREGTTGIASDAFVNCDGLRHLVLADSVEYLYSSMIRDCANVLSLTIGKNYKGMKFYSGGWFIVIPIIVRSPKLVEVYNRSSIEITKKSFEGGGFVQSTANIMHVYNDGEQSTLDVKDNGQVYITVDGQKMLVECNTQENKVSLESGTTIVGQYAFSGCKNLTTVELPDGVVEVESYAFADCPNLTTLVLPSSIKHLRGVNTDDNQNNKIYHLFYKGTKEQWNGVEKYFWKNKWFVYCTDGVVVENEQ